MFGVVALLGVVNEMEAKDWNGDTSLSPPGELPLGRLS